MTALVAPAFAVLAFVAEFAGVMRCAMHGVQLGRGFGLAILAQFALPVVLYALWELFSTPAHGGNPLAGFDHSLSFLTSVLWSEFLATLVAGYFGIGRFFVQPPADNSNRAA